MLTYLLLILCLNIDALSYGIANGFKQKRFSLSFIVLISLLSSLLFAIPLYFSKYIFQYFDSFTCQILNAVVLILMGLMYLIPQKAKTKITKKLQKNCKNIKNQNTEQSLIFNYSQNPAGKVTKINLKSKRIRTFKVFIECLVFSVDAMFTALLGGFENNHFLVYVAFYLLTNFLAILIGNLLTYKFGKKIKLNLEFFSGAIFILLGILKIFGI